MTNITCNFIKSAILFAISICAVSLVFGQEPGNVEHPKPPINNNAQPGPELMRQLGLSREQIQEIRQLNVQRRPMIEEAQRKVGDANRLLDEAVYADEVNEDVVTARTKELQSAQAEVTRIRTQSELSIRKLLTPEQLVRFRELRRRFAAERVRFQDRRPRDQINRMPPNRGRPDVARPISGGPPIKPEQF